MPRIIVTADLHLGITSTDAIRKLVTDIASAKPDAVVVPGDIGEPFSRFKQCLEILRAIPCPVGVVAGNHDVWVDSTEKGDSADLFYDLLPRAVAAAGFTWLESDSIRIGNIAITGTIAWYDYSRRTEPRLLNWTDDDFASAKPGLNNDGIYVRWPYPDRYFARMVGTSLCARLAQLSEDPVVRQILVATHVPVFTEQLVSMPGDDPVMDAYFANLTLGERLRAMEKVTTVVSGHTHRGVAPIELQRQGLSPLTVATIPSEYGQPRFLEFTL